MSKKNNLFTKSLPKSELFRVTETHFITDGLLGEQDELTSDFEFYSDDVKRSKKLPDHKFTNYISTTVHQDIRMRLHALVEQPSIIEARATSVDRNNKVDRCLELYVDLSQETEPRLFKSTLETATGVPTTVRVFSKADLIKKDSGKFKAVFRIVLIDPFHLVIPSAHLGMTKEQMEDATYRQHQNNAKCMSDWLRSAFE
jgi:hypothetical protein